MRHGSTWFTPRLVLRRVQLLLQLLLQLLPQLLLRVCGEGTHLMPGPTRWGGAPLLADGVHKRQRRCCCCCCCCCCWPPVFSKLSWGEAIAVEGPEALGGSARHKRLLLQQLLHEQQQQQQGPCEVVAPESAVAA